MQTMIYVQHNVEGLEYDIYGIFKAFCPEHIIRTERFEEPSDHTAAEYASFWKLFLMNRTLEISCFEKGRKEAVFQRVFHFEHDSGIRLSKKNLLKKYLYELLKERYDRELPWGTLTGIRPVKLIASLLREEKDYDKSLEQAKRDYLISDKKARLALDIAMRQDKILDKIEEGSYSLYISIPFCPTICSYCSFPSDLYLRAKRFIEPYMECLYKELETVSAVMGRKPVTIYIGGGTPSVIERKYLTGLFHCLDKNFDLGSIRELTFEAGRPDSMDDELFAALKDCPVSRLSINPQTMNDKTLKLIGRKHTGSDILNAFFLAKKYGYDNINSDLILGLPGEGRDELEKSLDALLALDIKSITVHSLSVKKGSKLKETAESYHYIMNNSMYELSDICDERIKDKGMYPYYLYRQKDIAGNLENIGYSFPTYEGLYNILILEEKHNIIGVGAGAVTKRVFPLEDRIERLPNIKDAKLYIERFDEALSKKKYLGDGI